MGSVGPARLLQTPTITCKDIKATNITSMPLVPRGGTKLEKKMPMRYFERTFVRFYFLDLQWYDYVWIDIPGSGLLVIDAVGWRSMYFVVMPRVNLIVIFLTYHVYLYSIMHYNKNHRIATYTLQPFRCALQNLSVDTHVCVADCICTHLGNNWSTAQASVFGAKFPEARGTFFGEVGMREP
jgi:hypothetical protein